MKQYQNLGEMLTTDPKIFEYYTSLPEYIRGMIGHRSENIHTEDQLRGYADTLLRGDN